MLPSQSTHRQTFIDSLNQAIDQKSVEESLTFANAAARVLLQWLGYDIENIAFIDGADRGIDAWICNNGSLDIFQVKTHDRTELGVLQLGTFANDGVNDLNRAGQFLLYEDISLITKKELKLLMHEWNSVLRSHKLQEEILPISVVLHLVLLGEGLTPQAQAEYEAFSQDILVPQETKDGISIQFRAVLHNINDAIDAQWRQENRTWLDKHRRKMESIGLTPFPESYISDNANAIFYCRAIDLVNAYDLLGYQLFEPNVRANIRGSRVNQEIRTSLMHPRTRQDFRFLNNGVTITCEFFNKPTTQKPMFSVKHPGIVNGLQTVVTLASTYNDLSAQDRQDFEDNCSVLVRLLLKNAVPDITSVVKATNNQNPMRPRNLASNNPEQLIYARLFAQELKWFYASKEGAWDAFEKNSAQWRPRLNMSPKDFQVSKNRKYRRLDNEDLAQTWLAFIGFASESVNEKKALFDTRFYTLVFKSETQQHGFDCTNIQQALDNAEKRSPNHRLMLIAHLARELANDITPSASENRRDACERLGINPETMTKAALEVELYKDDTFILNQALKSMSMLFTEYVGFLLFRSLGTTVHRLADRILGNHSFQLLGSEYALDVVIERIKYETFDPHDLLPVFWLSFVDTINDLLIGDWGQSYRAANIKIRFIFSSETRNRLYRAIEHTNTFMKKRSLKKTWAIGVSDGQGFFDYIKETIVAAY